MASTEFSWGRRQLALLVLLTLAWGLNWPVMKLGVSSYPPLAALGMLVAAAVWALGTQQMRRTRIAAPTLAIVFWMTVATAVPMTALTALFEHDRWGLPDAPTWSAIAYNAVLIFGIAQPIWLVLARNLPPVASSMSVMMIPVLGTIAGAWWLGERLHWQDGAAIALVLVAIASVMWPARMKPSGGADLTPSGPTAS